jgi:hypothetical protein
MPPTPTPGLQRWQFSTISNSYSRSLNTDRKGGRRACDQGH